MKILNVNLYFYPESIGGATVVAEKFAWGLTQLGHDVTNVFLSSSPGNRDFQVIDTPFGRSIGIKNILHSPANRFYNPGATSILKEIIDIILPERIFIHAVQHMGILDLLGDPSLRLKTCIVVHDFYWVCLQGFRGLPDGSNCNLAPSRLACRQCAWYPGLTDRIYASAREILMSCRAVVFPSYYLYSEYIRLLGEERENFFVQANPDIAGNIVPDQSVLPVAPGQRQRADGKTVFGFVGGPGESKGWGLVREFMERADDMAERPDGPHVVLFDSGRSLNNPWYPALKQPGTTIADPFHWSFASHALGQIDVLLMPSRVRESFGLAGREILSLDKQCIIRPSGALAEIKDYRGVILVQEEDNVDSLLAQVTQGRNLRTKCWPGTSNADYVNRLMSL